MTCSTGRFASSLGRDFQHAHLWYPWKPYRDVYFLLLHSRLKKKKVICICKGRAPYITVDSIYHTGLYGKKFWPSFPGALPQFSSFPFSTDPNLASRPKGLNCADPWPPTVVWRQFTHGNFGNVANFQKQRQVHQSYLRDAASKTNHNHTQHPLHLWVFVANQSYFFQDHVCFR